MLIENSQINRFLSLPAAIGFLSQSLFNLLW
jgi:hypothetical protein